MINRRQFLQTGSLILANSLAPSWFQNLAQGAQKQSLFFLHLQVRGGMHSLLGLDGLLLNDLYTRPLDPIPKVDQELYAAYRDDELIRANDILLGPGAAPLVPYLKDIAIVSGISMLGDSVDHGQNQQFSLGSSAGHLDLSGFPALVQAYPSSLSLGLISDQDIGSVIKTDLSDLRALAHRARKDPKIPSSRAEFLSPMEQARETLRQADRFAKSFQTDYSLYEKSLPDMLWLATAAAAYRQQMAEVFSISSWIVNSSDFDTHGNHATGQRQALLSAFTTLGRVIKFLKSHPGREKNQSLFDEAIVLVTTEFARTAWKEGNDGTSHNPETNSFIVAGGRIRGGQKVGASTIFSSALARPRSAFLALPLDFQSGRPLSPAELVQFLKTKNAADYPHIDCIQPGHIWNTIYAAAGVDLKQSNNPKLPILPMLLKRGPA